MPVMERRNYSQGNAPVMPGIPCDNDMVDAGGNANE